MSEPSVMDRQVAYDGYRRTRRTFHALLESGRPADLSRRSDGTRWTNGQLLWHMLLGFAVTRVLLRLAHVVSRLPRPVGRAFARLLNATTRPFDLVNYLGPCLAVRLVNPRSMGVLFDRAGGALERQLAAETEADLARGMPYPYRWDPYFTAFMTRADLYCFPVWHFDFHHRQLSLGDPPDPRPWQSSAQ